MLLRSNDLCEPVRFLWKRFVSRLTHAQIQQYCLYLDLEPSVEIGLSSGRFVKQRAHGKAVR